MDTKKLLDSLSNECKRSGRLRDGLEVIFFKCRDVLESHDALDYTAFVKEIMNLAADTVHPPEDKAAKMRKVHIDNVGIKYNVKKIEKEYATTLGRTVDELTDIQKRQAFLNAVLKA